MSFMIDNQRWFAKISIGKHIGDLKCIYYNEGFTYQQFSKWRWYFEYRAALFKVHNPKMRVEFIWNSYPYVAKDIAQRNDLKNKIKGKKATITKYENLLQAAIKNWNSIFPIEQDEIYKKALEKINKNKFELNQLEAKFNSY